MASRNIKTHKLKTWPEIYRDVRDNGKRFEVRDSDRNFATGDCVSLCEWCPEKQEYTGHRMLFRVGYILQGGQFGIAEGYCVFQLEPWVLPSEASEGE